MDPRAVDGEAAAHQETERALRSTQEMLRLVLDAIPQFICWKDRRSVFLGCNANYARLVGLPSPEAIVGKTDWQLPWTREQTESFLARDRTVMESGAPELHVSETATDARGRLFWRDTTRVPLRDGEGQVVGVLVAFEDVTERVRAEEQLRDNEERYRLLVENSPLGIFSVSPDGTIQDVNPEMVKILGSPSADATRAINLLQFPPLRAAGISADFERCLETGESFLAERVYTTKWQKSISLRYHLRPLHDKGGAISGVQAVVEDHTAVRRVEEEKARLEEQLRQAQKMEAIGRLAGGVAHDFNNILTTIAGYTQMMMSSVGTSDPLYADLEEVKRASERAAALTAQLLAFSRKQIIDPRVIDLNELLGHSHKMLARLIGEDIDFEFIPGNDLGRVRADPGQIEQVLINLAVNARDAMPDGGKLTVETSNQTLDASYCQLHAGATPGRYVMLAVSDTGEGMTAEVKEHLFEPFFTTKEKGKGTGLGLSMVYGVVKQNHGFISVYSEPGEGSTFKILLPRVDGPGVPVDRRQLQEVPTGRETVLLVEDEEMVRNLARKILARLGYTIIAAASAGEALVLAEKEQGRLDLLLTDVVMPLMNGRDLYARLQAARPGLKALFMSGYTENTVAHHGVLDGGVNFIGKPFTIETLARKVREALDGPGGAGG